MATLHILQHSPQDGPGLVSEWAASRGWQVRTVRVYQNEKLPEAEKSLNVLLLGGPMNIHQHADYPWLVAEKKKLAQYVEANCPLFGICLGGQLLADTLGAKVARNPAKELGWFPIHFTPESRRHFPKLPEQLIVLHWHEDTFSLPKDALRIASSQACPEQGFLWKDRVLGLQFHPEATATSLPEENEFPGKTAEYVQDRRTLLAGYHCYPPQVKEVLFDFMDSIFQKRCA